MTEDEIVGWHHQLDGHEFEYSGSTGEMYVKVQLYGLWDASPCLRVIELIWNLKRFQVLQPG